MVGQKRDKKISFQVMFLLDRSWSIPKKNSIKIQKLKKKKKRRSHSIFISRQCRSGQAQKGRKKFRSKYRFYPTRAEAFRKKLKKLKNVILASFVEKMGPGQVEKEKKRILHREPFLPELGLSIPKIEQK